MSASLVASRIRVRSAYLNGTENEAELRCCLEQSGYEMQMSGSAWSAVRYGGEGEDVKKSLRQAGFVDRDFKISVEYQRKWGFL